MSYDITLVAVVLIVATEKQIFIQLRRNRHEINAWLKYTILPDSSYQLSKLIGSLKYHEMAKWVCKSKEHVLELKYNQSRVRYVFCKKKCPWNFCQINIEHDIIGEGSQISTNQIEKTACFLASDWLKF